MKTKTTKKQNTTNTVRKCVLCGIELMPGEGNNPWPLADHGECCNECNERVTSARLDRKESEV